jgi:nitroreductase
VNITASFDHCPLELIRARSSVRRFTGEPLTGEIRRELQAFCGILQRGPFGSSCRFQLVDVETRSGGQGERVGAYGTIAGAPAYLAGAVDDGAYGLPDFGYLFELLLLRATDLNLGSCWLGGIFTRGRFANAVGLRSTEILPAVSPVGVPTAKRSMYDRIVRWGAGSKSRKPWSELYGDGLTGEPLSEAQADKPAGDPSTADPYAVALEMVRLSPSASNRQPWRCLREERKVHLYLQLRSGHGVRRDRGAVAALRTAGDSYAQNLAKGRISGKLAS